MHKMRSLLSTLGIVFAVVAVVTMLAIAEGAKRQALDQIGRLGTDTIIIRDSQESGERQGYPSGPSVERIGFGDVLLLEQIPDIVDIALIKEAHVFMAELAEADSVSVLAVSENYLEARGLRLEQGRFITHVDRYNSHRICVLGSELARRIGSGSTPGTILHLNDVPYRVTGVLRSRGAIDRNVLPVALRDLDNAVFIPLEHQPYQSSGPDSGDYLSEIIVRAGDTNRIIPLSLAIRQALSYNRDGHQNFEMVIPRELLAQAQQAQRLFNIVLGSIAGISLLVGGIGIMNIMLANVSERTREIGIRRAIGANRHHIVIHFLGESILLTVFGGILGVMLGSIAAVAVSVFIQWQISISLWSILLALFMSLGVGIVSGMYPAVKAAMMDPVEALRHS